MAFPVIGGTQVSGYNIDNSLRFNDGDSAYLSRSQTNGNQDKWTWSVWVKRGNISSDQCFFATTNGSTTSFDAKFKSSDAIEIYNYFGGGFDSQLITNRLFRDVSAWYHIVVVYDSGNATESDRLQIYINGTEETSFSTTNYPSLNADSDLNVSGSTLDIGRQANGAQFFDGYMSAAYLIDGQALTPTDFGETDDNGVWIPKNYTGSYGTNGFKLEFKQLGTAADATSIGADTSGNDNHFSQTNVTPAVDRTTDTPTNNFATMNALINSNGTLSEGNVKYTTNNSTNNYGYRLSTIGVASGKWYCEVKYTSSSNQAIIGIRSRLATDVSHKLGYYDDDFGIYIDGRKITNNTLSSYGTSWTNGDIIGILLDLDSNKLYFAKNGTIMNGGTGIDINAASSTTTGFYFISATEWNSSGNGTFEFNLGNPSFSISSSNSDGAGFGNFEYAPPTNYYSLCSKNLAEYG